MIFENMRDSFILFARPVAGPFPGTPALLSRSRGAAAVR